MNLAELPPYLKRSEVENFFPFLTKSFLNWLAHERLGPRFAIFGRDAVYRTTDVQNWIEGEFKEPGAGRRKSPARLKGEADGKDRPTSGAKQLKGETDGKARTTSGAKRLKGEADGKARTTSGAKRLKGEADGKARTTSGAKRRRGRPTRAEALAKARAEQAQAQASTEGVRA